LGYVLYFRFETARQFVEWTTAKFGISLEFCKSGLDEIAATTKVTGQLEPSVRPGRIIDRVDPPSFWPTRMEALPGDQSKVRNKLGWQPKGSARELCRELVAHAVEEAKRAAPFREVGNVGRRSVEWKARMSFTLHTKMSSTWVLCR
jgi:GDPmannose 4,6-dehydratase